MVEKLLDIHIDFYAAVTFEGFREVIDAIGGIEFDVPKTITTWNDDYQRNVTVEAGRQVLNGEQAEAVVFLGKVGVGIAPENLERGVFDSYDGIFLILDEEDHFEGETTEIPETLCVSIRFHGSHSEAQAQYQKLLAYITENKLKIGGFSREITMIDYGLTNDLSKFVTEISIPVECINQIILS